MERRAESFVEKVSEKSTKIAAKESFKQKIESFHSKSADFPENPHVSSAKMKKGNSDIDRQNPNTEGVDHSSQNSYR